MAYLIGIRKNKGSFAGDSPAIEGEVDDFGGGGLILLVDKGGFAEEIGGFVEFYGEV